MVKLLRQASLIERLRQRLLKESDLECLWQLGVQLRVAIEEYKRLWRVRKCLKNGRLKELHRRGAGMRLVAS